MFLNFSPTVTYWQTKLRIESLFCSSAMASGVTWLRTDTELSIPLISSASSSSIISCIAQLIDCASFFGSSGTLVVFRYSLTTSQTNEYEMTSTSSQSEPHSWFISSSVWGCLLKALAALLDLPVLWWMMKSNKTNSLNHWISDAPNLLSLT